MANYKQFSEIVADVCRAMGDSQQSRTDEVKAVINMVYLQEILNCDDINPCLWPLLFLDDSQKTKDSKSITGITAASPPVVTCASHGFEDGDIVQISGVSGMTQVNDRIFVVDDKAENTFELQSLDGTDIVGAGYTAYTSGGTIRHRGITLASGYEKVIVANWHGYNEALKEIDEFELAKSASWYDSGNISRPKRFLQKKYFTAAGAEANRVLWFPLPDDSNFPLRMWLEKQPDRLSGDTDVPILPYRFHDAIVAGAVARLTNFGNVQVENAVIWPQLYRAHIEAIKTANRAWWNKFNREKRSGLFLV